LPEYQYFSWHGFSDVKKLSPEVSIQKERLRTHMLPSIKRLMPFRMTAARFKHTPEATKLIAIKWEVLVSRANRHLSNQVTNPGITTEITRTARRV
jgi:hypothetical protein